MEQSRTVCKNGHPWVPENFYPRKNSIECKLCRKESVRRWQSRQAKPPRIPKPRPAFLYDSQDQHIVDAYSWCLEPRGYVTAWIPELKMTISFHRFVMGRPEGMEVDHINGIRTDNRRANLRICTRSQNSMNSKTRVNKDSRYKGVSKSGSSWIANIFINGSRVTLGRFKSEEDAAKAYDTAAVKHFGEYARINFDKA